MKKADLVTADGENIIREMVKFGVDPNRINYILHGVDTRTFRPDKNKRLKEEQRIVDFPIVISARNLKPIYDLETLIRSVPLILGQIPDTKFVIAGDGVQKNYLKNLAGSFGVLKNIRFRH